MENMKKLRERALVIGAKFFIKKPFSHEILMKQIDMALKSNNMMYGF